MKNIRRRLFFLLPIIFFNSLLAQSVEDDLLKKLQGFINFKTKYANMPLEEVYKISDYIGVHKMNYSGGQIILMAKIDTNYSNKDYLHIWIYNKTLNSIFPNGDLDKLSYLVDNSYLNVDGAKDAIELLGVIHPNQYGILGIRRPLYTISSYRDKIQKIIYYNKTLDQEFTLSIKTHQ